MHFAGFLLAVFSFIYSHSLPAESHQPIFESGQINPPHSRPISEEKPKFSGIQFNCSAEENAKLLGEFDKLFHEFGWTAPPLIKTLVNKKGTQLTFSLNTADSDTSTIDLFQRNEFGIKADLDPFTDRKGKTQNYEVASQKEIIASLLQHGRLSEFDKSFCTFEKFMEHVRLRQNIVKWGVRAMWSFPEDGVTKTNPKKWNEDWSLKPGVKSSDAIADAFIGDYNYEIGCTKACQKIMAQGILDFFKNVKKDKAISEHLDTITAPYPLDTMEMTVNGDSKKDMVKEGTLVDRHFKVPADHWVPGDWGWIKNPDDESAAENGLEGANIVYIGRGLFVVYYENDHDRTYSVLYGCSASYG